MLTTTALTLIVVVFILSYAAIALEHPLRLDKAIPALTAGSVILVILCYQSGNDHPAMEHLADVASILLFLLPAMVIVELMAKYGAFQIITGKITSENPSKLLWMISALSFFLSGLLDNMTTTIVMISVAAKLMRKGEGLLLTSGAIVISANAGGAFSPIGDVTTTMLWNGGQISPLGVMTSLFIPSLVCALVPTAMLARAITKMRLDTPEAKEKHVVDTTTSTSERLIVLITGLLALLSVPVIKTVFHVPPFIGMFLGLVLVWFVTERIHHKTGDKENLRVASILKEIDHKVILFFAGILLAVGGLETSGILSSLAMGLTEAIPSDILINACVGIVSAVVDNVPIVAAVQGMYGLDIHPPDSDFWNYLALSGGTGGSLLPIGSAAGVVAMGMLRIKFDWYVKKISAPALIGLTLALATSYLQNNLW